MGTPQLIIVTGPAGSGKTTLAHALAREIGCPALCRDEIKEGMVLSHPGFVAEASDPLTVRTYGLFFELIDRLLGAEVTLVAEAAFQHKLWVQGLGAVSAAHRLSVTRCQVDAEVATARMRQRMNEQSNRAAHADAAHLAGSPSFDPIHVDAPTIDVDTTDGYRPSLPEIVAFTLRPRPDPGEPAPVP